MQEFWAASDDLPTWLALSGGAVLALWLGYLGLELRRRERGGVWVFVTGALAGLLLAAALLRPTRVTLRGSSVGPRVVVLMDQSRRLLLPASGGTRRELGLAAVREINKLFSKARVTLLGFGDGAPQPLSQGSSKHAAEAGGRLSQESDLAAAVAALSDTPGERPEAAIVVSDGRLLRPTERADDASLRQTLGRLGVPLHTVSLVREAPRDASIRSIRAAGAAVAHQPLALTIEIGCAGGLKCGDVPVTVRELRLGAEPAQLAEGVAKVQEDTATVELSITLDRAGARVVEVSIQPPDGDTIPENNRRILTFSVARDRVRLLHVAGRPTYDVRALRMWLKSDESVDIVAFFILRTDQDNPETLDDSELALIPFPVDELFTQHLPSFDAVILQDIDAVTYKLERHLSALENYVRSGGGLIMVGGPASFAGGGYAGSALERVLPAALDDVERPFDLQELVPRYTEAGRVAPMLRGLRELFGEELPSMAGSNTLGPARPGSIVLWHNPNRKAGERPMPVLSLGEPGDGRAIALSVDSTHLLAMSEFAERAAGRAYGALWDGLVGWLMRDPRYEAARMELVGECAAGEPAELELVRLPGAEGDVELVLERLGVREQAPVRKRVKAPDSGPVRIELGELAPGGYTARARVGAAPATRYDFACESGGAAWADTRPDPERLERIAAATGGRAVGRDDLAKLPLPQPTQIAAERHTSPVLPPWIWTLAAALALGTHWVLRRRAGLA